MLKSLNRSLFLALFGTCALAGLARAQADDVTIESEKLSDQVYVLYGRGGNMLLFAGEERTILIDDEFAPLTEKILAKIATLTDRPVDFVLNTHYHGDHTGGNENMGKAGAVTFAHEHARELMLEGRYNAVFERQDDAPNPANLPVVTFSENMQFYVDGIEIVASYAPAAHTGGDIIVRIPSMNIIDMGDVFFNGLYPYVDISSGGSLQGVIDACETVLASADEETKIVPGHGRLGDRGSLQRYLDMLREFQAKARKALSEDRSLDEFLAEKISASYDDPWAKGWLTADQISRIVYLSEQAATEGEE